MAQRSEIFTTESIDSIFSNNPQMKLFEKRDWKEYLELLGLIYDLLEGETASSRIPFDLVEGLLQNFYANHPLASLEQKISSFVIMAISDLQVLKDSHDSKGNRFLEATRAGKNLLKLCEELILNRKKFTGLGAEGLMNSLNNILLSESVMTLEQATLQHHSKIKEYREDIKKMQAEGVENSKLLNSTISRDELFGHADEIASYILSAGEDIKASIEGTRKELIKNYSDEAVSIGQTIEYVVDFYQELAQTPEYKSFSHAKDVLSHIEGVGGHFRHKDISQILLMITNQKILPEELVNRSFLKDFSRKFQFIINAIDQKISEQINLLKIQVHYVVVGNTRQVQEDLSELVGIFYREGEKTLDFLHKNSLKFSLDHESKIGPIHYNDFTQDVHISMEDFSLQVVSDKDREKLMKELALADEVTIKKVLDKLQLNLSRKKEIQLSSYPLEYGLTEFYVLSEIQFFSEIIVAKAMGRTDLIVNLKDRAFIFTDVTDRVYSLI